MLLGQTDGLGKLDDAKLLAELLKVRRHSMRQPVLTLSGTMTILGAIIIALSLVATVLRLRIPHPAAGPAETDDFPEPPTGSHRRSAPDREEQP